MKKKVKHGRRLRSMVELAQELGKGRDVFVRGTVRRNTTLKGLKWNFLSKLVLGGEAFKTERARAA